MAPGLLGVVPRSTVSPDPVIPAYDGASLIGLVPGLLAEPGQRPAWFPGPAGAATQVVLLVVDGLGWNQLVPRAHLAPTLAAMSGGPITSVAPTTTATALASIVLGVAPARHGMVGFRLRVGGEGEGGGGDGAQVAEVLNVLRWRTPSGDARTTVPPRQFQPLPAFGGRAVPVVSRMEFAGSGFSDAHLGGSPMTGWATPSGIGVEVGRALAAGEPLVYAYYDGLDKTAHVTGLGEHYDAELAAVDGLAAGIIDRLPPGTALVVTADHGHVEVADGPRMIPAEIVKMTTMVSGEARFRWLHAAPGRAGELLAACREWCGGEAWVRTVNELDAAGWYGGRLDERVRARLGDVALVAREPVAFLEGHDPGEFRLRSMHGSLTADEMWVPLVAAAR